MSHPYQSTLDLLHVLADRLPPRFPRELGRYMALRLGELERDESVARDALDRTVAEFGQYTWHYRRAWEELYERDGKMLEERRFLEILPTALRERLQSDTNTSSSRAERSGVEGSRPMSTARRPMDIVRLPIFERYTPEDRLIIEEALLRARREAADDLARRMLAGELPDYEEVALRWKRERLNIEEQLLKLRAIAREKPHLADEAQKMITEYEIGFSGLMGREPTVPEVTGVVRDYANRT